jgi:transposase
MSPRASYRRVEKYYKTSGQYWKERNRRKLVLQMLEEEHLSVRQVAERLKVSEKTVRRDLAKIKPYYERRIRHYKKALQKENDDAFNALSSRKQESVLRTRLKEIEKLSDMQNPSYIHHHIKFVLNLNQIEDGCPTVKVLPLGLQAKLNIPITISIVCLKDKTEKIIESVTLNWSK